MSFANASSEVEIKYEAEGNWNCRFLSKITIQNNSSRELDQWKLEFDWDRTITCVLNAKIEKSQDNHYTISSVSRNKVIPTGGKISLIVTGKSGNSTSEPSNFIVTDIYDQLAQKDIEWQQYYGIKTGEEFQKSFAHGLTYLLTKFPSDEPHRVGYEIIEKNPVEKFIQAKYKNVKFKTEDGITLKGLFFPVKNAKGTIIMLHGYGSTALWEVPKLKFLLDNGYQILAYNSRYWNYYETPEKYTELMSNEIKDVGSAVHYLKTRHDVDNNKIAIYGFSYGACNAELFAPFSNDIKAAIFDGANAIIPTYSPYFTWESIGNDVVNIFAEVYGDDISAYPVSMLPSPYTNSMKNMDKPALFIHGLNDTNVSVSEVDALYDAAIGPKEKCIFENSGHCNAMYTEDKEEYESSVLKFLETYLN